MEHVLCGTDFTAGAEWAFERAVRIVRSKPWGIRLLHVEEDGDRSVDTARIKGEALARYASIGLEHGVAVETRMTTGSPGDVLAVEGAASGCNLVVLGPRSKNDMTSWFLGSTAERVMRHCPTAILAVHRAPEGHYRRALACLDFEDASRAAFRAALSLDLVPTGGLAVVHAFYAAVRRTVALADMPPRQEEEIVQGIGNQALSNAIAEIRALGLNANMPIFIEEGETYTIISSAASRWSADLLIMGSHGRSPVAEFFLGSTATRALREAPCDVLVKREQ